MICLLTDEHSHRGLNTSQTFIDCNVHLITTCMAWLITCKLYTLCLHTHRYTYVYLVTPRGHGFVTAFRHTPIYTNDFIQLRTLYAQVQPQTHPLTMKCTCTLHTLVHTYSCLLAVGWMQVSLIFIHSFNLVCITSDYNKSSEALFFITASPLQLDIHLNIHLLQECKGKTLAQIPVVVYPPGQALQSGWKSTSICFEMSPACRADRAACQHPLHLCLRPAVLEGNNLAPVELLVGPVWLLVRVVKSVPLVCFCACFLSF